MSRVLRVIGAGVTLLALIAAWAAYRGPVMALMLSAPAFCE